MDNFDQGLEDLLDLTDSESSASSNAGIFESNQPFVLELHELKKDEPAAAAVPLDAKIKKKKKKKSKQASENAKIATSSTSSVSDSVPAVTDTAGKEEFYDANESYHALTAEDSQAKPAASVALAQAQSEHTTEKRSSERRSSTGRVPSTITKPVTPSK